MEADVVIVGAGFAGAATAFHLCQLFDGRIVVLDREEVPGYHASGRNASLVLQSVSHPGIRRMVAASVEAYLKHRDEIGYLPVGSILLGRGEQVDAVRDDAVASEWISQAAVEARIGLMEGHRFERALFTPTDGVMDISSLLQFYLRGFGDRKPDLHLNCGVLAAERQSGGYRIQTTDGPIHARVLVNGAGAWAGELAMTSGVAQLPMKSFKRHLFILDGVDIPPRAPFLWSLAEDFYFRAESGGLLFSVCDEEFSPGPFVQTVNPDISVTLAEVIDRQLPALLDTSPRRVWSCFRTKTPNGDFHLGWDEVQEGFYWVAGLGGHGMGASWEIGRIAARQISCYLEGDSRPFSGDRLAP